MSLFFTNVFAKNCPKFPNPIIPIFKGDFFILKELTTGCEGKSFLNIESISYPL
jgi:hypothetical protein